MIKRELMKKLRPHACVIYTSWKRQLQETRKNIFTNTLGKEDKQQDCGLWFATTIFNGYKVQVLEIAEDLQSKKIANWAKNLPNLKVKRSLLRVHPKIQGKLQEAKRLF